MKSVKDKDGRSIKLFAVGDCEWWMGENVEQVAAAMKKNGGEYEDDCEPVELTDEAAQRLIFYDDEDRSISTKRPFIEELRNNCKDSWPEPVIFACTEY